MWWSNRPTTILIIRYHSQISFIYVPVQYISLTKTGYSTLSTITDSSLCWGAGRRVRDITNSEGLLLNSVFILFTKYPGPFEHHLEGPWLRTIFMRVRAYVWVRLPAVIVPTNCTQHGWSILQFTGNNTTSESILFISKPACCRIVSYYFRENVDSKGKPIQSLIKSVK